MNTQQQQNEIQSINTNSFYAFGGSTPVPLQSKYPLLAALTPIGDNASGNSIVSGAAIISEEHLAAIEARLKSSATPGSVLSTKPIITNNTMPVKPVVSTQPPAPKPVNQPVSNANKLPRYDSDEHPANKGAAMFIRKKD